MKRQNLDPDDAVPAVRAKAVKRHYLDAVEGDSEPETNEGGNLSRIFTFLLLLHVFLIGAVVLYNVIVKKPGSNQVASAPVVEKVSEQAQTPEENTSASSQAQSDSAATNDTAAQAKPAKMIEYVVTNGENLQKIADSHGVSIEVLKSINKLNAAGDIYVGRKLLIPQGGGAVADAEPAVTALDALRARSTVSTVDNPLSQPAQKRPETASAGAQESTQPVPVAKPVAAAPAPAAAKLDEPAKPKAATPAPAPAAGAREHEVQSGETFYAIARKYGISANELMKANGFTDPGKLRKGTVLKVPAK